MSTPTVDRLKAKNHRTVARAIAFLLISAGLYLVLSAAAPIVDTAVKYDLTKSQLKALAPASKF